NVTATVAGDCDDTNAAIHPGAVEVCSDVVDNDCNGTADCDDTACNQNPACPAPTTLCSGGPFTCKSPGRTQLTIRNSSDDHRDSMTFTWSIGDATTTGELGDPTADTQYAVCLWDDVGGAPTLVMHMDAPPAGNCAGRPCWRPFAD